MNIPDVSLTSFSSFRLNNDKEEALEMARSELTSAFTSLVGDLGAEDERFDSESDDRRDEADDERGDLEMKSA